jgi:catechol 2,3-dioxygenase-like lactoylglutathione lyase family enzyme
MWHEDPPGEREVMPYTSDPAGNRLQLVPVSQTGGRLIDHVAVEVHDIETAEVFYQVALGGRVAYYHGRSVQHYLEARAWGEGIDPCAPWTRLWPGHGLSTNPRSRAKHSHPTQQAFYDFGGCSLGVILANHHRQEPPEPQIRGTPRTVFAAPRSASETAAALDARDVSLDPEGRIDLRHEREGDRLFLRDPGGNFVELVCASGSR